jgi:hypothetical protein
MKKAIYTTTPILLIVFFSIAHAGNVTLAPPPVTALGNTEFIGDWKGKEECQAVSAPVATLVITPDGPDQVFLTGVYSMLGKIRGVVKGNTITIPRQLVIDPNFKNFKIEGSLTITSDYAQLNGVFVVLNNELRDYCTVSFHK